MASFQVLHAPITATDDESSDDYSGVQRASGQGMNYRKLAVSVGLVVASVAMVATILEGKISAIHTTTNHIAAISQLSTEDPCADHPMIKLTKVVHNNLGGKGPDTGPEGLVYEAENVVPGKTPEPLLLVINASNSDIDTDPNANGFHGKYARIAAKGGTHIDTTFELLKKETREPAIIRELDITFFDLDTHSTGNALEYVQLDGFQQYFLTKNTQVEHKEGSDGYTSFRATKAGGSNDNPTDPLLLTVEQKDKAVTIRYIDAHTFHVKFGAEGANHQHRWFNFVFRPSLLCAKTQDSDEDPDIVTVGEEPTTTAASAEDDTTTTTKEEKKCLFTIPIINFCIPKFF